MAKGNVSREKANSPEKHSLFTGNKQLCLGQLGSDQNLASQESQKFKHQDKSLDFIMGRTCTFNEFT